MTNPIKGYFPGVKTDLKEDMLYNVDLINIIKLNPET